MVRVVVGEVVALISLGLFLATVAVWAQVLGALELCAEVGDGMKG